jgi:hypothetical protein
MGELLADKLSADKLSADELSADELSAGKLPLYQQNVRKSTNVRSVRNKELFSAEKN